MSAPPDPSEISAPKDPAEYRPKPLLGPAFWVWIVFGLVCVIAGAVLATLGPKLLPARPKAAAALQVERTATAPLNPAASPVTVAGPLPPAPEPAPADVAGLAARVSALEGQERGTTQAAASALAASALLEASRGSGPFRAELHALRAAAPDLPELAALSRMAETGAPSRAALAASFPDYAMRAASAARAPGEGAGLGARVGYALTRIVSIRRVAETSGTDADALLARAEQQVQDGDIDRALRTLDQLPAAAREAMAPWRARAERRAEIDRQAAALRRRALQSLAQPSRGGP
ncbi:COG4223 family protein [Phenylobacterium sp.]|jgi:hypothetical protein|uniref:COG4223 family protein n=1 Tax=Phenylobacterium sp. TaxID=1871053 RepID=UPI002F949368